MLHLHISCIYNNYYARQHTCHTLQSSNKGIAYLQGIGVKIFDKFEFKGYNTKLARKYVKY